MKVACIFAASGHTASYKLGKMILPRLEEGYRGVEVGQIPWIQGLSTSCTSTQLVWY